MAKGELKLDDEQPDVEGATHWEATTTAQVHRRYRVKAASAEQAHQRLKLWLRDPDVVTEGTVNHLASQMRNHTEERLLGPIEPVAPSET